MKILHVAPLYPAINSSAGTSQAPRNPASALAKIRLDVGLLSSRPLGPAERMQPSSGMRMLSVPMKVHRNPLRISPFWISRLQDEFGVPDIIHFHTLYIPFQCALEPTCNLDRRSHVLFEIAPCDGRRIRQHRNTGPERLG